MHCLSLDHFLRESYQEHKDKLSTFFEGTGREVITWDFDNSLVFARTDCFIERLNDILVSIMCDATKFWTKIDSNLSRFFAYPQDVARIHKWNQLNTTKICQTILTNMQLIPPFRFSRCAAGWNSMFHH